MHSKAIDCALLCSFHFEWHEIVHVNSHFNDVCMYVCTPIEHSLNSFPNVWMLKILPHKFEKLTRIKELKIEPYIKQQQQQQK